MNDVHKIQIDPWMIFNYEVFMLFYTTYLKKLIDDKNEKKIDIALNNALVESRFLHLRILADILLSRKKDDINIDQIIKQNTRTSRIKSLLTGLKDNYGSEEIQDSPCWVLHKMLAHPSKIRKVAYNYASIFEVLFPMIYDILEEVQVITQNDELKEYLTFAHKKIFS